MSVTIRIPGVLQPATGGRSEVQAEGATVGEVLESLATQHETARDRLFNKEGGLNRFVVVAVNGEDVRFQQKLETPVKVGDEVSVVPIISGGRA